MIATIIYMYVTNFGNSENFWGWFPEMFPENHAKVSDTGKSAEFAHFGYCVFACLQQFQSIVQTESFDEIHRQLRGYNMKLRRSSLSSTIKICILLCCMSFLAWSCGFTWVAGGLYRFFIGGGNSGFPFFHFFERDGYPDSIRWAL